MPLSNRTLGCLLLSATLGVQGQIKERMQAGVDKGDIVGAVFQYTCGGKTVGPDAVGLRDAATKAPMRADSIFQIMSMTKPVTAVGIMMLVEEGKVALNDPIERHLPEFKGVNKLGGRAPMVRDLLTHTSGMMGSPPQSIPDLYTKMDRTLAEAVTLYAQHPLEFEPGTKWQYSNPGIAVLGRIIEVQSGKSYEQFLDERIFKPLGMKDSHFFLPESKRERLALVHAKEPMGVGFQHSPATILGGDAGQFRKGAKYPAPEFGLYSTAADLNAFYQAMLNGKLLSKDSMRVMTEIHTQGIKAGWLTGNGFGLGWEVVQEPVGTLTLHSIGTYSHGGAFGTFGWVDSAKKLTGVFLVQQTSGGSAIARDAFIQMSSSRCEY